MLSNLIYSMVPNYKFVYTERSVDLPDNIKKEIESNWDDLMKAGKTYTNGELFTVSDIRFDDKECLIFEVVKTNFAHYLHTFKNRFEGQYICRSIASSALLLTCDDYYVLGKMSGDTSLADKIKFIGGAISKDDFKQNEFLPFECIKRELQEEIGLDLSDLGTVVSVTPSCFITRKNLSFINVCFKIKLNYSSDEITTLFKKHDDYLHEQKMVQELDSIILVKNEEETLLNFLHDKKDHLIDYMKDLFLFELGKEQPRSFV